MKKTDRRQSSEIENKGVGIGEGSSIIKVINKLRSVGAQMEIDLPTIALCGQQSSGKSSLTEAISGVSMPAAAGTCTRCPTELRLVQRTGPWECNVGIRKEWNDNNNQPLPKVTESPIGTATQPDQVKYLVSKAQSFVSNTFLKSHVKMY